MRKLTALYCILLGSICLAHKSPKEELRIKCYHTNAFCGGMLVTEDMMKNARHTVAGKTLYIKKGSKNSVTQKVLKKLITDSLGKASVFLAPGTYYVVDNTTIDSTEYKRLVNEYKDANEYYSKIDLNCLKNWFETPLLVVKVKNISKKEFTIETHGRCSFSPLCVEYYGPPPP